MKTPEPLRRAQLFWIGDRGAYIGDYKKKNQLGPVMTVVAFFLLLWVGLALVSLALRVDDTLFLRENKKQALAGSFRLSENADEIDNEFLDAVNEAEEFEIEVFRPTTSAILKSYTSKKLRKEFVEFLNNARKGMFTISAIPQNGSSVYTVSQDRMGGLYIDLSMLSFKALLKDECFNDTELFKDYIVLYGLMAERHALYFTDQALTSREKISYVWWYACEDVIQPALSAGRFTRVRYTSPAMAALRAYNASDRDPNSQYWQEFISMTVPAQDSNATRAER
ncbi:MAG: hypothetical protein ACD_76C00115G0005 [uncultured bacterium]|nr:MAG: hypothetical protein ACD_76C00115G0005 [uncultured bacterium]HBD05351.1 hypothetical protein [Candidatus Uhrbacteria bacterium]